MSEPRLIECECFENPGYCKQCHGWGVDDDEEDDSEDAGKRCPNCDGKRLCPKCDGAYLPEIDWSEID